MVSGEIFVTHKAHQFSVLATAVLETLLKTNRPATDQERATILESMAPTNAKLKMVEGQISDTMDLIEALKLQVEQAEIKLQRLRMRKWRSWRILQITGESFLPLGISQRMFFARYPSHAFKQWHTSIVLLEIYTHSNALPSRPDLPWVTTCCMDNAMYLASMDVRIWSEYANSTQRAIEWLGRSGGLALTLIIDFHAGNDSNHYSALFDVLLDYSTRWKEIKFASYSPNLPIPMIRIASLKAADLPLLQSVSLNFVD